MLEVIILGSSSKGNCIAVSDCDGTVIIDAGLRPTKIVDAISEYVDLKDVHAILCSHTHNDHVQGLKRLAKAVPHAVCMFTPLTAKALEEKNKLPNLDQQLDFYVIDEEERCLPAVLRLVAGLRRLGWRADYSFKRQKTPKQLKEALKRGSAVAVFVRPAAESFGADRVQLSIKNLRNQKQYPSNLFIAEFLDRPELKNVRTIEQFLDRTGLD